MAENRYERWTIEESLTWIFFLFRWVPRMKKFRNRSPHSSCDLNFHGIQFIELNEIRWCKMPSVPLVKEIGWDFRPPACTLFCTELTVYVETRQQRDKTFATVWRVLYFSPVKCGSLNSPSKWSFFRIHWFTFLKISTQYESHFKHH